MFRIGVHFMPFLTELLTIHHARGNWRNGYNILKKNWHAISTARTKIAVRATKEIFFRYCFHACSRHCRAKTVHSVFLALFVPDQRLPASSNGICASSCIGGVYTCTIRRVGASAVVVTCNVLERANVGSFEEETKNVTC